MKVHYKLCRGCKLHGWWEWSEYASGKKRPRLTGFTFFRWSVSWGDK